MKEATSEPVRSRRKYDSPLRRQRAAETRERIIAAGVELLHGFPVWNWSALTVRGVARKAEVAERTVRCLRRTVPAAVPGIVFLSGGQSDQVATAHLNAMNLVAGPRPWKLSFSYSRALQEPALKTWNGDAANGDAAKAALLHRARLNSAASRGGYESSMEEAA